MRRATAAVGVLALVQVAWACTGDDPTLSPGSDAGGDVGAAETGTPGDGGADGGTTDGGTTDGTTDACALAGCAVAIATGQKHPQGIAVNGAFVYWINTAAGAAGEGAVLRCPITGCTGTAQEVRGVLTAPLALAVDDVAVYFSAGAPGAVSVTQCDKSSCASPIDLATGETRVAALVSAESKLFYARGSAGPLGGASMCTPGTAGAGSCPSVLTGINAVEGLAVIPTHYLYGELISGGGVVQAFLRSNGTATNLASNQGAPRAFHESAGSLYWLNSGAVQRAAAPYTGAVQKVATANNPGDLAVDATNVYFTNRDDGTVARCSITGCVTPTILATGQKGPEGIAVDATHVYWSVGGADANDGAIMRLPK